jgi:PTH1 family peptidyl-tRNA hydrolase
MKPQTFMNLSGDAVQPAISFWKLTPRDVIVVFDDADMGFGQVRARNEGSSGGHNGMQSVIERLGTDAIARVKIGIGRSDNPNVPLEDWVLNAWTAEEMEQLAGIISQAADRVIELL